MGICSDNKNCVPVQTSKCTWVLRITCAYHYYKLEPINLFTIRRSIYSSTGSRSTIITMWSYLFGCGRILVLDSLHIAKCARATRKKAHICAHPKNCAKIYRFTVHFLYVWLCVWLNVNVSKTSAFFKTSYFAIIVLWQGRKISSMYRGTKQNCCKYLRLLPSRILIGSTCIIHTCIGLVIFGTLKKGKGWICFIL